MNIIPSHFIRDILLSAWSRWAAIRSPKLWSQRLVYDKSTGCQGNLVLKNPA